MSLHLKFNTNYELFFILIYLFLIALIFLYIFKSIDLDNVKMNENIQLYNYIDHCLGLLWPRTRPRYAHNLSIVLFLFEHNCEIIVCYEIFFLLILLFYFMGDYK